MLKTDGLLGRTFQHGSHDCFGIMRDFYALNFGLEFPDVARPDDWWEPDADGQHLNLYMDRYHELGFSIFHGHPMDRLPGDVILMAIKAKIPNHGAILLPNEQILHHFVGQVSCIESYNRPLYRNTTMAVLRHPKVDGSKLLETTEIDAWDLIPQRIRDKIGERP